MSLSYGPACEGQETTILSYNAETRRYTVSVKIENRVRKIALAETNLDAPKAKSPAQELLSLQGYLEQSKRELDTQIAAQLAQLKRLGLAL